MSFKFSNEKCRKWKTKNDNEWKNAQLRVKAITQCHYLVLSFFPSIIEVVMESKYHTSKSSNGLPRRYTSFFLLLSLGKTLNNSALHPMSKIPVLPKVTKIKLDGGIWPDVATLIINPNCQERETEVRAERWPDVNKLLEG